MHTEQSLADSSRWTQANWLWASGGFSAAGVATVVIIVIANISTIAGDPGGGDSLGPFEIPLLSALLAIAWITAWMLWKSWRARTPHSFRPIHWVPVLVSALAIAIGIWLPTWRAIEILVGNGGAPY